MGVRRTDPSSPPGAATDEAEDDAGADAPGVVEEEAGAPPEGEPGRPGEEARVGERCLARLLTVERTGCAPARDMELA